MAENKDDGHSTAKTKICRFFPTKKGCKFGDGCRFLHLEEPSNDSGSVIHEVNELRSGNVEDQLQGQKSYDAIEPTIWTDGKDKEKQEDSSSGKQGIACKFFQRKRGCLRGDKCPYVHVIGGTPSGKNRGKEVVTSRTQTPHQGNESPCAITDNEQEANQLMQSDNLQSENSDKNPPGQGKPLAQEDSVMNCTVTGQGFGVILSNKENATKRLETGKGIPPHKKKNDKQNVDRRKGTSVPARNNTAKGKESATGLPLSKQDTATKNLKTGQGVLLPNEENVTKYSKSEKGATLSQKNSATQHEVTRQRASSPNKENIKKHAETRQDVSMHSKDDTKNVRGTFTLGDAIFVAPKRLRSTEIQQLKRRFGERGGYSEIKENSSYKIKFKPTDPDWVSTSLNHLILWCLLRTRCNMLGGGQSGGREELNTSQGVQFTSLLVV